jgi:hypothetical protein
VFIRALAEFTKFMDEIWLAATTAQQGKKNGKPVQGWNSTNLDFLIILSSTE